MVIAAVLGTLLHAHLPVGAHALADLSPYPTFLLSLKPGIMEKTLPLHSTKEQRRFSLMNDEMFTKYKIPLILLYYGLASSTLIVINKLAVHNVKAPVFILMCQLLFAAISVKGSAVAGFVEAEKLQCSLIKPFILIVFGFLGTLYANIQVMLGSEMLRESHSVLSPLI